MNSSPPAPPPKDGAAKQQASSAFSVFQSAASQMKGTSSATPEPPNKQIELSQQNAQTTESREQTADDAPLPPPAVHLAPPPKSSTPTPEPTGAAQFITNLNARQRAHLQFAVPVNTSEANRLSHFLEEPRQTPVPYRFTFEAIDSEARRIRESSSTGKSSKLGSSHGTKSSKSSKSSLSAYSSHTRDDSGSSSDRGTQSSWSRHRGTSSVSSMKSAGVDFKKEVEHLKEVVHVEDWKFYATGATLCLINLVMAWDATAISIALPTITFSFNGTAIDAFWLGISFLVAGTVFLPLFSAFSEIFGRKAMLLTGLGCFTIGSFVAAVTGNFTGLHLGRTVQGIGAGGVFVLTDLIISDLVSPLDKRRWSAILGAIWALGAVTGPAIGEALAERSQWRWIFWINLPFCAIGFVILPLFAQLKGATPGSMLQKLRNYDWIGFTLLSGSMVGVLLGISWGGSLYSWSNPRTILPLQFGLIGGVLYCVWSWFSPIPSVISLDGFMTRTSLATYFGTMVQGCIMTAFLYFMPFYFYVAKAGLRHLSAGVRWFPWTLPLVFFILVTFIVVSRWNIWLLSIWLGWFLVLLGVAMSTLYSRSSSDGLWICIAIVLGSGVGILYPSLHTASELIAAQEEDEKMVTRAVTNYSFFQLLGKTFGVGIATSIFENGLIEHLKDNPTFVGLARQYANDAVALVIRVRATSGGEGSPKTQIADAYIDSLRSIWITMAVLAGLALLASCFMMPKVEQESDREVEMKNLGEP